MLEGIIGQVLSILGSGLFTTLKHAIIRSLYNINKDSWQDFHGALDNREKRESLAQQIFPHLQYNENILFTIYSKI